MNYMHSKLNHKSHEGLGGTRQNVLNDSLQQKLRAFSRRVCYGSLGCAVVAAPPARCRPGSSGTGGIRNS